MTKIATTTISSKYSLKYSSPEPEDRLPLGLDL